MSLDRPGPITHPRFRVLGRIGTGGMGEVYRVRDEELGELVALKIIPGSVESEESVDRLRREVRLARRIASEHVCRIFDIVDVGAGVRGLMMELIDGRTLAELMAGEVQRDYFRFARWGAHVAEGLAAAHGLSIVHRDLKPENVMIDARDRAVILDFGIARQRQAEGGGRVTQAGIIMGTPLYMSPEQLAGEEVDGRSDLYSLGLILAELASGKVPLGGGGFTEIHRERVLRRRVYRLRDHDQGAPDAFSAIVDRLLAPSPAARQGTATEVQRELLAFAAGRRPYEGRAAGGEGETLGPEGPRRAVPPAPAVRAALPPRAIAPRRSVWLGLIAMLSAVALLLVIALLGRSDEGETPVEAPPHAVPRPAGGAGSSPETDGPEPPQPVAPPARRRDPLPPAIEM